MENSNNNSRVPKLRFPGFTGEWEEKKLEDVVESFKTGKLDANAMVADGKYRFYTCSKDYSYIDTYAFEGDCILIAGNGAYLGYVHHFDGKFNAYQRTYVLSGFLCESYYLEYCIRRFLPDRIIKEKKEGNTPYIVLSTLTKMPIFLPPTPEEQQKIAECLTEMDETISAQAEKVESLKTHKKGLMQQLFPQPGETIPKLRFPGFEGEWVEKKLGDVGVTVSGLTYSPSNVSNNGLLVLRSSNIKNGLLCFDDCVFVQSIKKYNPVQENDILICVRNGSSSLIGKCALIPRGITAAFGAFMMVFRSDEWAFVFQLLKTERYNKQIEQNLGARINSINSEDFKNYTFLFPPTPTEQQKIADCLSELDKNIEAEAAKLEALKNYKKGLMQQLFPEPIK